MTRIQLNIETDDPDVQYQVVDDDPKEPADNKLGPVAKKQHFHFNIPAGARIHGWGNFVYECLD